MTNPDFQKWLRQGRGRAAKFIQAEDPARYRDALLHACTHNLCYDRQCEETRGHYLASLVGMTADPKLFREGVLAALASRTEEFGPDDILQMFAVAHHWAKADDEAASRTLYDVFARDAFGRAEIWCGDYLVKMDGLNALLFVLQFFGRIEESEGLRHFESLVTELEERDGKDAATEGLALAAASRPDLAQLLEMLRTEPGQKGPSDLRPSYSPEDVRSAADGLPSESDENRLWAYLRIFKGRRFPGPHDRLMELAKNGNWRLSHAAAHALTNIDDPDLRSFALELMETPDRCDLGVKLLACWSQPGDYRRLEQALRHPMDDQLRHSLGLDILRFVKVNLTIDAEDSLKLLYENGPCSMCRESCVNHLIALNRLPDWMRDECRYDADSGTRELVAGMTEQE